MLTVHIVPVFRLDGKLAEDITVEKRNHEIPLKYFRRVTESEVIMHSVLDKRMMGRGGSSVGKTTDT